MSAQSLVYGEALNRAGEDPGGTRLSALTPLWTSEPSGRPLDAGHWEWQFLHVPPEFPRDLAIIFVL